MNLLKPLLVFILLISIISCGDKTAEQEITLAPPDVSTNNEVTKLEQLINLPVKPVWIKWEVTKVTKPVGKLGTDDWSIVARMALDSGDIKILTVTPLPNKIVKLPAYAVKPWMEDIIAANFKPDETGDFYIPQGTMLSAEQFYRDPLLTGAIYMISETEILLFLQTE